MVSAYFKNIGQTRTLIQLLQDRAEIQNISGVQMKERFEVYNLELQEVLIGTPTSGEGGGQIEQILVQLRSRQIAEEQVETYNRQERAAVKERELREAESRARQQQALTESEIAITVQENQGKAEYARAQQQAAQIQALAQAEAEKIRILAEGEAKKIRVVGESDADRAARVGVAQALALEEQVRAYGGPQFQLVQNVMNRFAEAIEKAGADVVPKIQMTTDGKGSGILVENLLALLLSGKLGETVGDQLAVAADPQVETLRSELRRSLQSGNGAGLT
ncbi:MAG TPA: flotillin family protein, partial [Thermoanaerobaculia bacterium]|nr:flotillin family protein [Thermoanaerobaculia bacterium]